MTAVDVGARLGDGVRALARGAWDDARVAFEDVVARADDPEALDGLGRALWWLRDSRGAVVNRERAYAGFRRDGDLARAARIALWLSREYAVSWGNMSAARGWLGRAERLLGQRSDDVAAGWLELGKSERAIGADVAMAHARRALELAARTDDADLELYALAQLGLAEVSGGLVDQGLVHLDEAMAGVTGGESTSLETFADVCCTLLQACDVAGDTARAVEWTEVLESFARSYDHLPLLAFCRTCCASVHVASGRVDEAEKELLSALRDLDESGQRARCLHPAARLAELRVAQNRLAEAEELLVGLAGQVEGLDALVALKLAAGEPGGAALLLERRLSEVGCESLHAAPLLSRLVEARLAAGDAEQASRAAASLERLAETAGRERTVGLALLARGRVCAVTDPMVAPELLRGAVNSFAALGLRIETAHARLELARALASTHPVDAVDVARRAHAELEALGMARDADDAAALLRRLGAKSRSGPRAGDSLTRRETQVLRLVGEGATNVAIGRGLFISPKTVEHHVARIYRKLGVGTRAEAAAWAARNLARGLE